MSVNATPLCRVRGLRLPTAAPQEALSFDVYPGLTLVQGGEGRGKTSLLQALAGVPPDPAVTRRAHSVIWPQAQHPDHDAVTAEAYWAANAPTHMDIAPALIEALGLSEHMTKPLYMLSAGSRRKVGLLAAATSGADLVLLHTPYAALDLRSCHVVDELLEDAAQSQYQAWVIADYAPPAGLVDVTWAGVVNLGD